MSDHETIAAELQPVILRTAPDVRPWRAVLLAPRGEGSRRRRGSDGVRVVLGVMSLVVIVIAYSIGWRGDNAIVSWLSPPPSAMSWIFSLLWIVGTLGAVALVIVLAAVVHERAAIRDVVAGVAGTTLVTAALRWLLGSQVGRSSSDVQSGITGDFPILFLAIATCAVLCAVPYLSRALQRFLRGLVAVTTIVGVVHGAGLPLSALGAVVLGWVLTAVVHLVFGSPLGLLSLAEASALIAQAGIEVSDLTAGAHQVWGAQEFSGIGPLGRNVLVSIFGRDAADAQALAKIGRFLIYRDSGPSLALSRLQQVEHEAFLTMVAARTLGAQVPDVVAAGIAGDKGDALLVLAPPPGQRLSAYKDDEVSDGAIDAVFALVERLSSLGMSHGVISTRTIVLTKNGDAGLIDFALGELARDEGRIARDHAATLAAVGEITGAQRAAASAVRVLGTEVVANSLVHLQGAALPAETGELVGKKSAFLKELRTVAAAAAGVPVPELVEARRLSPASLIVAIGTLIGGWALLGVLINVAGSFSTIRGAKWYWVMATFVLAQLVTGGTAMTTIGSVLNPLPFLRVVALEISNSFTSLAAGSVGVLAARVRFFQRQGLDATLAVSSGVVASTASWIVKGSLFIACLPFAWSSLHFDNANKPQGAGAHLVSLIIDVLLVAVVASGIALLIPRLRRLAASKLRPKFHESVDHLKVLASNPRKLVAIFGGSLIAQLLVAAATSTALRAFGAHLPLPTIIVVLTIGSMLGGISPVPGGMGVVEAGMVLGLTAAGIPSDVAFAAVFVQRLFTSYLPPIWGWFVLMWMRRKEYL